MTAGLTSVGDISLNQIDSPSTLAHFVHQEIHATHVDLEDWLKGLNSAECLSIPGYSAQIPVREIYGTVIEERFETELGPGFRKTPGRIRGICSFLGNDGSTFRYHIFIFTSEQYAQMKSVLVRKLNDDAQIK